MVSGSYNDCVRSGEKANKSLSVQLRIPILLLILTMYNSVMFIISLYTYTGQFWNVPISVTDSAGVYYIDVHKPGDTNYRHIPTIEYGMTWDHAPKPCYYAGNSQGGPERSKHPQESVIEGSYKDYETAGLFATDFKYKVFKDGVC